MVKAMEREPGAAPRTREPVIDCDIHEMPGRDSLKPYLDERFHDRRLIMPPLPYTLLQGGTRDDAWPHMHGLTPGVPGSSYELLRDQVLDPFNVEMGVLTGLFHPGAALVEPEVAAAHARAYNDWVMAEWLPRDERLHASIQVAFQDPMLAAEEIERCASEPRMVQVMLPAVAGDGFGLRRFRPMFEAAARHDLVITLHQGSTTNAAIGYPPYYCEWHVGMNQSFMAQMTSMVFGGLFDDHPNLRLLVLEGVFAWMPYLMRTMDWSAAEFGAGNLEREPSAYVRDHVWFSSQPMPEPRDRRHLLDVIEMTGSDEWLVFSTDYAHWDWDSPDEVIPRSWPRELQRKVLYDNAKRLFAPRLQRTGSALADGSRA